MTIRPTAIVLVLANLVPLAGVIWLDWAVFDVMMLYWAENVAVGVVNVMRMFAFKPSLGMPAIVQNSIDMNATEEQRQTLSSVIAGFRYFLIPFFIVHYGMFCYGHYSAVVGIFGHQPWKSPLWIGVAAIAISHLISFWFNFIGKDEYMRVNAIQLMQRPYGRIMILHISIIGGGFLVTISGNPFWMLPFLVVTKTIIDLRMHLSERRIFGTATAIS